MLIRGVIQEQPQRQPGESYRAGEYERPAPPEMDGDPGDHQRRNNCADVCPGVKYARGESSFFLGEPLRNSFDAGWKDAGLAQAQRSARHAEGKKGTGDGVAHGGEAPKHHRQRVAQASAKPVNQPPDEDHAEGIRSLKRKHQIAVVDFIPAQVVLERDLEDAQHLPVHVVLGDAEQQEGTDDPANVTGAGVAFRLLRSRNHALFAHPVFVF